MQPKQLQPYNQIKEAIVQVIEICDLIWKEDQIVTISISRSTDFKY